MRNSVFSPQKYARIAGIIYLVIIATGVFGEIFVRNGLIVNGNAEATTNNIIASQFLWRLGIAGDLVMHLCDVPLMLILYVLLRPVNKNLALLALLFVLVQTSVLVATKLNMFTPLFLAGKASYLNAFDPPQRQALTYISLRAHNYGFVIGLLFFAVECLIVGWLIIKSTYLPKVLGILMQIAGLCYLVNSFCQILFPELADKIVPAILFPCFIGELSLALWLLIKGINLPNWEKVKAANQRP